MRVYQTDNMELAARDLAMRHHYVVVIVDYEVRPVIRFRANEIADIPLTMIRTWDPFAPRAYADWRNEGGLLLLYHNYKYPMTVECDAMLFVECPPYYERFVNRSAGVRQECVIYRPPTWELHERSVLKHNPGGDVSRALLATANGMIGRELDDEMQAALTLSGYPPDATAVFRADEILAITGVEEAMVRNVLKSGLFRARYLRYHCYTLNVRPERKDVDLRWAYELLEEDPDRCDGTRMLRFDFLERGRVNGFPKQMKRLIRQNYITREKSIYVVTRGYREPFYPAIDAVANANRGDWFKMKNLVDSAPEYPITCETP